MKTTFIGLFVYLFLAFVIYLCIHLFIATIYCYYFLLLCFAVLFFFGGWGGGRRGGTMHLQSGSLVSTGWIWPNGWYVLVSMLRCSAVRLYTVDGCEIYVAPPKKAMVEKTIVCWYLQGNQLIPGFLGF